MTIRFSSESRNETTNEDALEELCEAAQSFYERGYAFGSTGNLSIRAGERIWITPTGKPLKSLTPERLACIDLQGNALNDERPSKEFPFHTAIYRVRADVRAVVHLHSTYSAALSCLEFSDESEPLPPLTPYYFMRVAPLAVLPYFRPGSTGLAESIEAVASAHNCMLLRNHGLVCAGAGVAEACDRAEELEQTAKLFFILRGERTRQLTAAQIEELNKTFRN